MATFPEISSAQLPQKFDSTHDIPTDPLPQFANEPHTDIAERHNWPYIHESLARTLDIPQSRFIAFTLVFKSTRLPGLSPGLKSALAAGDDAVVQELRQKYPDDFWKYHSDEVIDDKAQNFCIWPSIEIARSALRYSQHHRKVALLAEQAYEPGTGIETSWHQLSKAPKTGKVVLERVVTVF